MSDWLGLHAGRSAPDAKGGSEAEKRSKAKRLARDECNDAVRMQAPPNGADGGGMLGRGGFGARAGRTSTKAPCERGDKFSRRDASARRIEKHSHRLHAGLTFELTGPWRRAP